MCELLNDRDCTLEDINMLTYNKTKTELLSQARITNRPQRSKLYLEHLRDNKQPPALWTEMKFLTILEVHNHHKAWIYAVNTSENLMKYRLIFGWEIETGIRNGLSRGLPQTGHGTGDEKRKLSAEVNEFFLYVWVECYVKRGAVWSHRQYPSAEDGEGRRLKHNKTEKYDTQ